MSLSKPVDEIDVADLQGLLENQVPEQKIVEYKSELPVESDEGKKEFLADVSSLANTSGGHIFYGIKENEGLPVGLTGLEAINHDVIILRLENLLRDCVEPRIQGISMRFVPLQSNAAVLVIKVPESWVKPHAVKFKTLWRFYARNSAGKYALDVQELRSAFLASTALAEQIHRFRFERLERIRSNETPVSLRGRSSIVLHVIPYSALSTNASLDLAAVGGQVYNLRLIDAPISNHRYNLDGFVAFDELTDAQSGAYLQIFRTGIFESVSTRIFSEAEGRGTIPSTVFRQELQQSVVAYLSVHRTLSINPPFALLVTIMGVQDFSLAVSHGHNNWLERTHRIDRDILFLPEVLVEDYEQDVPIMLRPMLDALWNAAGWPKCLEYGDSSAR